MNTGKALETKRLVLVPGNNARDDEPFINMLQMMVIFEIFAALSSAKNT
ncbi:MAG: hypothetical protein ACLTDC_15405 [Lachnospiraceae bacterium]